MTRSPKVRRWALGCALAVAGMVAALVTAPSAAAAPVIPCQSAPFTDVAAGNAFCLDIAWIKDQGVTAGSGGGLFDPRGTVSRGEMSAFLYRLANPGKSDPACVGSGAAADVPVDHPFCGTVGWLKTKKISEGYPDGSFRPADPVSRGEMSAFLYRLANPGKSDQSCSAAPFTDVSASAQFCGTIAWLKAKGISGGYGDGTFGPADGVSREAMAAFLHRTADSMLVAVPVSVGTVTVGAALAAGRYVITGDGGSVQIVRGDSVMVSEKLGSGGVPSVTTSLTVGDTVTVSGARVTFTPAVDRIRSTLTTGMWLVGRDIAPGNYDATPGAGQSGTLTVAGKSYLLSGSAGASGPAQASVTVTLKIGAEVAVEGLATVRFTS